MATYGGQASDALRAARHAKAREREIEEAEFKKKKLADSLKVSKMDDKFSAHYDSVEQEIKASTVGLVTMDQMKQTQIRAIQEREKQLARKEADKLKQIKEKQKEKEMKKAKEQKKIQALSFDPDEDEEDEDEDKDEDDAKDEGQDSDSESASKLKGSEKRSAETDDFNLKRKRFGMNPDVNTVFLPDRDRDDEENRLREELRLKWEEQQKAIKEEEVTITYSYWDGSGHRRTITVKKGNTIYQFLVKVLDSIRGEFSELKIVSADQLMFVKEDLIIPQHNTFYDFIVSRARGKSGPLFNFDVHDDVRIVSDATVEKEESHAGKVVLRSWYDRNKHIFPASRWEPYDPTKTYEKYTINDAKLNFNHKPIAPVTPKPEEGEETPISKLSATGCRGMCKCSKSTVCEMHYQAKNYR